MVLILRRHEACGFVPDWSFQRHEDEVWARTWKSCERRKRPSTPLVLSLSKDAPEGGTAAALLDHRPAVAPRRPASPSALSSRLTRFDTQPLEKKGSRPKPPAPQAEPRDRLVLASPMEGNGPWSAGALKRARALIGWDEGTSAGPLKIANVAHLDLSR